MNFDFLFFLTWATVCCGLISLVDMWLWAPLRKKGKMPMVIENARGFFPVLLAVLLIRSFLYQPFKVPSESLEPTLFPGDFLLVNQYHFGMRMPIGFQKITQGQPAKRGDIVVFRWPVSPDVNFVKRVVGVPGDVISYRNKVLTINGQEAKQTFVATEQEPKLGEMQRYTEDLLGIKHDIYVKTDQPAFDFEQYTIPKGHYFVMGDNRDASDDSRFWGLVPDSALIGQATRIWLSIDPNVALTDVTHKIRLNRFWTQLYADQSSASNSP